MPSSMQWDMMSSTSFKKLMNFLSKLDDSSAEHSSVSQATLRSHPSQHANEQIRPPSSTQIKNVTPPKKLSTQSSKANITTRTKSVNNAHTEPGQPPRIPPRNPNLRSSVNRPPELPKRTNSSTTTTVPNSTRIVLKRPTLKSGIPLPSNRPVGISNIPKPVTKIPMQNNNTQHQNQTQISGRPQNRQNRTYRPPF